MNLTTRRRQFWNTDSIFCISTTGKSIFETLCFGGIKGYACLHEVRCRRLFVLDPERWVELLDEIGQEFDGNSLLRIWV